MTTRSIVQIGSFEVDRDQTTRWRSGELRKEWVERFPQLFDSDDLRLAESQGPQGFHFSEWLGAIILFHLTGYLSLVSKYEFPRHKGKQVILGKFLPKPVLALMKDHPDLGGTQCPDLLAYSPDLSDWFFCEVKGPGDRLRERQRIYFDRLARVSGRPISLLRFKWRPKRP